MLTENEKEKMRMILRTLIYNDYNELIKNYTIEKHNLSNEALELLIFGDNTFNNSKYKTISGLEHRWCLKSIMEYHVDMTKKITKDQYNQFFCL